MWFTKERRFNYFVIFMHSGVQERARFISKKVCSCENAWTTSWKVSENLNNRNHRTISVMLASVQLCSISVRIIELVLVNHTLLYCLWEVKLTFHHKSPFFHVFSFCSKFCSLVEKRCEKRPEKEAMFKDSVRFGANRWKKLGKTWNLPISPNFRIILHKEQRTELLKTKKKVFHERAFQSARSSKES